MAGKISLRPSNAETWTECTMAPIFICDNHDRILADDGSQWSQEGNVAHDFAEKMLRGEDVDIPDPTMRVILEGYVDFVLDKWSPGDPLLVEQQVPLWYMPKRVGKVDAVVIRLDRNNLYITDLKYGEGIAVFARNNKQLAIYGRSTVESLKAQGFKIEPGMLITLSIYQPRCSRGDLFSVWALRYEELIEFTDEIGKTAVDIQARHNLRFHASKDTCRFCDAAGICPERARKLLGTHGVNMQDKILPELNRDEIHELPAIPYMSVEMMCRVMELRDDFTSWFTAIEKHLYNLLKSGTKDPGMKYKLVGKKDGNRQWYDEAAAVDFLSSYLPVDVYSPRKTITAPQAEKLIPAKERDEDFELMWSLLVRKKPAEGKTMVPLDDERENIVVNPAAEFQPIDQEGFDLL